MTNAAPREALSATHAHLLAVIAGEAHRRPGLATPLRVLDVGCGDGLLMQFLHRALPHALGGRPVAVFGFDVAGHGSQHGDVFGAARARLSADAPEVDWTDRLRVIAEGAPWPFDDAAFDLVVSNQVLEHVADGGHFFAELARVLRPGGVSAHLFPSGHLIVEPHLGTPFAHWLGNGDLVAWWLATWARLGPSAYGRWAAGGSRTVADYARVHADYLQRFTHYRTQADLHGLVKAAGLHGTFAYTPGYLACALRRRRGRPVALRLDQPGPLGAALASLALRHLISVTLVASRDGACVAADAP